MWKAYSGFLRCLPQRVANNVSSTKHLKVTYGRTTQSISILHKVHVTKEWFEKLFHISMSISIAVRNKSTFSFAAVHHGYYKFSGEFDLFSVFIYSRKELWEAGNTMTHSEVAQNFHLNILYILLRF